MKILKHQNPRIKKREGVFALMSSCFNALLNKVADMGRRGVSEEIQQGEFSGLTRDGEDIKVRYGYGVKVGLDDFAKKMKEKKESYGVNRTS